MAKFQYTAMDGNGKEKKGVIEAENEQEASAQLKQQGLFPTSLTSSKAASKGKSGAAKGGGGLDRKSVV